MPSALEIYYRNKGKKPASDPVKRLAAKEFLGQDLPKKNIGYFHKLMDILDRPGNATRALLVGKLGGLKGLIPFAQTIENLTGIDVALNKEEMVYGTEVIEKWFGKQKQRKGKIDTVDVFGFMVEVIADPIWLTGIGGLTKAGKAAKLAQSGIRAAKATGQLNTVRKMIKAAKAGKVFDSTKLSKAFLTVYKSGGKPALAKNWATQAAKGQRALLKFAGKPLIKGEKALASLEKIGTKLKAGKVGKIFLAPTRRVPTQYKDLHEIYTHFGRDLPHIRRAEYLKKITSLYDEGAKAGKSAKEMDDILRQFVQRKYAKEGAKRFFSKVRAKKKMKPAHKAKLAKKVQIQVAKRREEAGELLAGLPPEQAKTIKGLGGEYQKIHKGLISKELAAGAPAKQIMYPIGYARRTATPEFRAFMEANKHHPIVAGFARDMSTRNAAQRMRNKVLGWMTDDEALDYFRKLGYKGDDVFERGMAMPTYQRAAMSTQTVGAGETIQEAVKKFGKPDMPMWRGKGYTFSAEDLMTKVGMRPEAAAMARGRVIPNEVASALLDMHSLATSEEALTGFWRAWTSAHRFMKGSFTVPWPAYHTRNMFSNFVLNWIGGVKNPKSYLEAMRLQMGRGQPIRLASGAVLSPDDILRNADQWGVVRRSLGMFEPSEILPKQFGKRAPIRRAGAQVGMTIEDNARLAHFIEKLKTGFNFNDAAVSAKNVLFDYGDLSRIERRYLRDRGIFFYTFMRKNISLQAKTLLQQPGKQAFWSHVMGGTPAIMGGEEDYPDWWREQIVSRPIAIPGIKPKEGEQIRFASMGMPLEEAFGTFAGPGHSPWTRAQRIAKRQFGKLTPLVTTPTEFITGQDIFYGKDISKMGYAPHFAGAATKIPYIGKPIQKALDIREIGREGKPPYYTMSPQASWLFRKSPLGRAWSSAQMLSQRGQPWPVKAMHFGLGQKPRIYDPEVMKERAEKQAITGQLEEKFRKGEVRQFKRFYVPKGMEKDKEMDLLLKSQ